MAAYPVMIAGGFIGMMALIAWSKQRSKASSAFGAPDFATAQAASH
jgi:hypothetical protein